MKYKLPSSCMACHKGTENRLCDWEFFAFHKTEDLAAMQKTKSDILSFRKYK